MIWSKLIQGLDFAMSTISLFSPRNTSKLYYTYTHFFKKDRSRAD
jgi:hypothetical protein